MHFVEDSHSATYPAISEEEGAVPEIYVTQSAGDNDWTKVEVESIKDGAVVDNRVKPYIFNLSSVYEGTRIKICLTNKDVVLRSGVKPCTALTEIELKKASKKFITNNSAKLESLTVNGKELSKAMLESGSYKTPALVANLENVKGADNAAVTVLPAYKDSVKLILESEDHATRNIFEIKLNQEPDVSPEAADLDYPVEKLVDRVIAGSELPEDSWTENEGPNRYVLDGKPETHWHTDWKTGGNQPVPLEKRWIGFNFETPVLIDALRYLPRTNGGTNGYVTEYCVEYLESDGGEWKKAEIIRPDGTTAETGIWDGKNTSWQLASFKPINAKQIRLVGVHTYLDSGNDKHMAVAELRARTVKQTTDISKEDSGVSVEILSLDDDGVIEVPFVDAENPVTPAVKVTSKEKKDLEWGIDYKVSYENNTEFSTDGKKAKVIVEGIINYSGKLEKEFTIKKAPRELTGIFVKEKPEKIQYQAGETFDPTGLELTLMYNDKTQETVAYKGHEGDFKFSPALDQKLKDTDKKVTVTYGGKETVVDITVQPEQVTVNFLVDGKETPVKVVKGQTIGTNMPQDPVKSGYTFKGWNTKKDGSGEAVTADTVVKEDMSVYAIFEKGTSSGGNGSGSGEHNGTGSEGNNSAANGGSQNAGGTANQSVKTGDTANVISFVILAVAAVAAILSILALKRRKK